MATILQLPPEQGGITFGPFEGIVQLGSDARRVQITLDARNGVYPLHATLALSPNGAHQFAPTELGAKCFVVQKGSSQVWPVNGAVQVSAGDALIVGTPGGPRFTLVETSASARQAPVAAAAGPLFGGFLAALDGMVRPQHHRRNQSMGQGIANEFVRRGQMQLFRQGGFRELSYFYQRARNGSLLSPVTIVGAIITLVGMFGAGTLSCFGGLAALWSRF